MSPNLYLTPRERDVLALLIEGKTNREIAARLYLSQGTIKSYLSSIYEKLDVSNRTEAAVAALQLLPDLEG
jgi:DNA-binding NarL/FixJ family response regulator